MISVLVDETLEGTELVAFSDVHSNIGAWFMKSTACDPTARISIGSCHGFPINFILILNGISVIDTQQILPVALCSCIAPVVSCGLEKIVMPHMELR